MNENIKLTEQEKLYWEKIFNTEFIFEKGCYSTCNSHCCRWDTPDLPLTIIPKGGTLFYLPKEYAYISKYGKITEIPPYKMKTKLFDKELFINIVMMMPIVILSFHVHFIVSSILLYLFLI